MHTDCNCTEGTAKHTMSGQDERTNEIVEELIARFRKACREFVTNEKWGEVGISLPFERGVAKTQKFTKVETFR